MKKGAKWSLGITVVLIVLAGLWAAAFAVAKLAGGGTGDGPAAGYNEEILRDADNGTSDKVVMINVVGEIFSDPDGGLEGATDSNIIGQLDRAVDDPDTKAIIIQLETPGGGVVASDGIYERVREVSKEEDIPVIALMGDVAASGGYYIAAGADEIVAHPSTWTGSIGVIAMLPNFEKAADKLGIGLTVIKSGALKDAGSPFRQMTPQEQSLFQTLINEAYDGFVKVVADGRELDEAKVRELADGRIYSGKQAKEVKLVDFLGDLDLAFERAKKLADIEDAVLVRYTADVGFGDILGVTSQRLRKTSLQQELGIARRPGASYLWIP
ncbi:MAG: signal peptide peptidase SppA [Actinomycetota bacterium]